MGRWHVRALLALLAGANGYSIERDLACEALWPDSRPAAARNRLYHTVLLLRRSLDEAVTAEPEWVCVAEGRVRLLADIRSDAAEVRRLAEQRDPARAQDWLAHRTEKLAQFAPWLPESAPVNTCRREIEAAWLEVLNTAVEHNGLNDDTPARRRSLEHLIAMAPAAESAHRALMELDLRAGRAHQVLRRFANCVRAMAEQLGLRPSTGTSDIAAQARSLLSGAVVHCPTQAVRPIMGREPLLRDLRATLLKPAGALVTLTGPGGVGKSRLALEAGRRLAGAFPGGVLWANLRPLAADADPAPAVAAQLGIHPAERVPALKALAQALGERRTLLVLDGADNHRAFVVRLHTLVPACRPVWLLLTALRPLGIDTEHVVTVPPLPLPAPDAGLGEMRSNSAIQLLLSLAPSETPRSDAGLRDLVRLVHQLDGLPLAIEQAAQQLAYNTPAELCSQLEDASPPHHATTEQDRRVPLCSALDRTVAALSPAAAALYGVASVFPDSFDATELTAVAHDLPIVSNVGAALAELERSGLVAHLTQDAQTVPRWRMLHSARRHAQSSAAYGALRSHAVMMLVQGVAEGVVALVSRSWPTQQEQVTVLLDNQRERIDLALERGERIGAPWFTALVESLLGYWELRGEARYGIHWCRVALAAAEALPDTKRQRVEARLHIGLVGLLLVEGDVDAARSRAQCALADARRVGDATMIADAACAYARACLEAADLAGARHGTAAGLVHARRLTDATCRRLTAVSSMSIALAGWPVIEGVKRPSLADLPPQPQLLSFP